MKTKTFKTVLISGLLVISLFVSVNIIRSYYKTLRTDFLLHSQGKTEQFINSFIN